MICVVVGPCFCRIRYSMHHMNIQISLGLEGISELVSHYVCDFIIHCCTILILSSTNILAHLSKAIVAKYQQYMSML